jgi:hypothetical protein
MLEKRTVLRLKKGDVFRLKIAESLFGYAQYVEPNLTVFFSVFSKTPLDAEELVNTPAAFKLIVYKSAFKNENCEKIGNVPVMDANVVKPTTFKQDIISGGLFIYQDIDPLDPFRPATFDECKEIEVTSFWEFGHVRTRLLELYEGKPNRWLGKHVIDQEKLAKYLEKQNQ